MNTQSTITSLKSLYENDYQAWIATTIKLLSNHAFDLLDLENLIEEIEDIGKNQKDALESNLTILLMHILKYKYQAKQRQYSNSWRYTIVEH